MKNILMSVIGWGFLGLGVLGLFLPFLQGILFIMIGLAILSTRSEKIARLMNYLERRYPRHYEKVTFWQTRVSKWFKKDP